MFQGNFPFSVCLTTHHPDKVCLCTQTKKVLTSFAPWLHRVSALLMNSPVGRLTVGRV